ncbi:hypothetical protein ERO13_A02G163300v2 [Gossypium hirsutum]|uniref:Uncharacterized protein n=4 Tax=Gossypium TaxID=3633 RepID=A0ABR0QWI0_GOSAR|nr:hypothetical protein ERO13_A02G163300v2 [Gossypium hirsutum]KAK5843688.1 hypothetical protein PVK06_006146 [Gossypium arboreum]PPR80779.1 hypothetical protein GOBAR_AA39935 [Gossypium barbadense]TYH29077.1 hypothetical protein ES288_A02G195500v1 [Gossypium darwinii]TYI40921.1 hypothetical protein ES332_A02G197600v1 [Gossypium tomentosum]
MLDELCARNRRLDKKLKSLETWRTVLNALFFATFVYVLVFSVVAAALSMKSAVTASASALTVAIVPAWKWCDGRWKRNEEKVNDQKKLTRMYYGPLLSKIINIRVHVELLEKNMF